MSAIWWSELQILGVATVGWGVGGKELPISGLGPGHVMYSPVTTVNDTVSYI